MYKYSDLITLGISNDIVKNMVKAFMRVFVCLATVDQVLLAEGAALAVTPALVCAVPDDLRLSAAFTCWVNSLGIVAEED
jgi:hypothetical protein